MPAERGTLNRLLELAIGEPDSGLRLLDRREEETWLSWGRLEARAAEVAGALRRLGIQHGQRVALIYPTSEDFFNAFFGILLAGAVPVPLYPPVRLGRLDEYHAKTAAMVVAASAPLVLAARRVRRVIGPTIELAAPALGCHSLDRLPEAEPFRAVTEPEDLALVQFSSGTTVDPKPVALSHRAILAQVAALNVNWPDSQQMRVTGMSWLPLYHDMGLIGCVFPSLEKRSVLTLLPPEIFVAKPALWLRAISRYKAMVSVAPNFAYGLCVDRIQDEEMAGVDLSHWRIALNGAEAVSPTVLRAFQERFAAWGFRPEALTPVYGLSEATLAVTFSDLDRSFHSERFDRRLLAEGQAQVVENGVEMVSVGRPLEGTEIQLEDEQGCILQEGRVGRIMVRGPSLMEGYLGRPEATAKALKNGWLDTGDLGFVHDGELYLTARAKDVVILRGRNHAPAEIEQALDNLSAVRTGCAVAVSWLPEGAPGEVLALFVEHRKGAAGEVLKSLPEACRQAVLGATGLRPDAIHVLPPGTLPRTSSGKLRRGETLKRHLAGRLEAPKAVTPWLITGAMAKSAWSFARQKRALKSGPPVE